MYKRKWHCWNNLIFCLWLQLKVNWRQRNPTKALVVVAFVRLHVFVALRNNFTYIFDTLLVWTLHGVSLSSATSNHQQTRYQRNATLISLHGIEGIRNVCDRLGRFLREFVCNSVAFVTIAIGSHSFYRGSSVEVKTQ